MVSASGATNLRSPWKTSRTWVSMNSTASLQEGLQLAGHARRGAAAHEPEQAHAEHADADGHQQAVDVERPERTITDGNGPVLEMVGDVFAGTVTGDLKESIHRSNHGKQSK